MSAAPFWSVVTDEDSMRAAAREQGADVRHRRELHCHLLHRRCLRRDGHGVPGGRILFLATVAWNAVSTIARTPEGDCAKALRVRRSRPAPAPAH
jgi:hypothetical protein